VALVLDRPLYAGMSDVIVVAEFAERISATLQPTIGTNRSSTVGTFSHAGLPQGNVSGRVLTEGWSIHELGTARMGSDPKTAANG